MLDSTPIGSFPIKQIDVNLEGGTISDLNIALQELRAERSRAQMQVEKLDQAISVIESLNGTATTGKKGVLKSR
jgi:hypothetical protein